MGNGRRVRRGIQRGSTLGPVNPGLPLTRPSHPSLDQLVDDDEAHIGDISGSPEKKWFAKLAYFLADDRDYPPPKVFLILTRSYGLDLHGVVHACRFGIPWGMILLADFMDKYWGPSSGSGAPPLTQLVSALRTSNPECDASAMLLALSRTSSSLEYSLHALRWGGQYTPAEVGSALELVHTGDLWGFLPPNKSWRVNSRQLASMLQSDDLKNNPDVDEPSDIEPSEVHHQLKQASSLMETVIGKWRGLREYVNQDSSIPSDRLADAIGSAFDAATRLSAALHLIETSRKWIPPLETGLPMPSDLGVKPWGQLENTGLPTPPFSQDSVPITWDTSFWYSKAASAYHYLSTFLIENGELTRAVRFANEALTMAHKSGEPDSLARAQNNLGHALIVRAEGDDLATAKRLLTEAGSYYRSTQNAAKLTNVESNLRRVQNRRKGGADVFPRLGGKTIDVPEFQTGVMLLH